ncbi:hypothetical protein Lal_00022856 [Lupinus albus]|nr:hypothetical protein Lal_00022856 [Lupinus albus]
MQNTAMVILSRWLLTTQEFGGSIMSGKQPATMTRDNLYWLSHDQVALFKTFRGTASRCKQTINHAVPRIKQPRSLLYDILLHWEASIYSVRPPTDPPSNGPEKLHLRRGGSWGADPPPQIPGRASHAATRACSRSFLPHVLTCGDLVNHDLVIHTAQMHGKGPMA